MKIPTPFFVILEHKIELFDFRQPYFTSIHGNVPIYAALHVNKTILIEKIIIKPS